MALIIKHFKDISLPTTVFLSIRSISSLKICSVRNTCIFLSPGFISFGEGLDTHRLLYEILLGYRMYKTKIANFGLKSPNIALISFEPYKWLWTLNLDLDLTELILPPSNLFALVRPNDCSCENDDDHYNHDANDDFHLPLCLRARLLHASPVPSQPPWS